MKRVLFITHTPVIQGGGERSLLVAIKTCIDYGYRCTVICESEGEFSETSRSMGARVDILAYQTLNQPNELSISLSVSIKNAYKYLSSNKFDVVIINTLTTLPFLIATRLLGIPNIVMARELISKHNSFYLAGAENYYLENIKFNTDLILYNSTYTKQFYKNIFHEISDFIYYPEIEDKEYSILSQIKPSDFTEGLKIVSLATFTPHNKQDTIINALSHIKKIRPDIKFSATFYGSPANKSYISQLKSLIKNNNLSDSVNIKLKTISKIEAFKQSNVSINPATHEAFGRTTIEAQTAGLIALGANSGGSAEIIKHLKDGILFTPNNYLDLAEKLVWIYENQEEVKNISKNGRRVVCKYFSPQRNKHILIYAIDMVESRFNPAKSRYASAILDGVLD